MTPQEYISSGAIEACIHGIANAGEQQLLQQMAADYPEVAAAKLAVEIEMEQLHFAAALKPAADRRQRVLDALQAEKRLLKSSKETTESIQETIAPVKEIEQSKPATPMVPITAAPKPMRWMRGAVAVSILLLMGSILLNFYFWSQYNEAKTEYAQLLVQQNTLLARNEALQTGYNMMKDPGMQQVVLDGVASKEGSKATIFWDSQSRDVYLMVNNLPLPEKGKQYQLWAIVGGVPVSAGVVQGNTELLLKMETIPNAEAFAITLEKEGGSPTPNLEAMFVFGKV